MAVETLFVSTPISRPLSRPRWARRVLARCRLWRVSVRREWQLGGLDAHQRADIGWPGAKNYRWLDELMRGYRMR